MPPLRYGAAAQNAAGHARRARQGAKDSKGPHTSAAAGSSSIPAIAKGERRDGRSQPRYAPDPRSMVDLAANTDYRSGSPAGIGVPG